MPYRGRGRPRGRGNFRGRSRYSRPRRPPPVATKYGDARASRAQRTPINQIHKFVRTVSLGTFQQLVGAGNFSNLVFRLDQTPNVGELTALFDQYRLDMVEITFRPYYHFETEAPVVSSTLIKMERLLEKMLILQLSERENKIKRKAKIADNNKIKQKSPISPASPPQEEETPNKKVNSSKTIKNLLDFSQTNYMSKEEEEEPTIAPTLMAELFTVIDYDDGNAPTTIGEIRQYATCKITNVNSSHFRRIRPHISEEVYDNSIDGTGYANSKGPKWLDAAYPGIEHFGLKMGVTGANAGQTALQTWEITARYFISTKCVR